MSQGRDGKVYSDRSGENSPSWRGGRHRSGNGAIQIVDHDNPRADSRGRVYEHILLAEKALGKPLPPGAEVHHVDRNRANNTPSNLVICQDHEYHALLHRRLRAYQACGHANRMKCVYCKTWDAMANLYASFNKKSGARAYHRSCHAAAAREGD